MGAVYAALYLSPAPLSLDDLVQLVNVTYEQHDRIDRRYRLI